MEIGVMKARPPHVSFSTKPVEDRDKSISEGHPCFKDVHYVHITPQGSKDSVTKPVKDWLENSDQQVRDERLPPEWAMKFHAAYDHWKRGEEMPVDGTALVTWPAITPSELASCKSVHVLTIEELAVANDETCRRIGMGAVALRQRAKTYLDAAAGPGKLVAMNKDLAQKLADSESRRLELEGRVQKLEALSGGVSPVKVTTNEDTLERKL